MVDVASSRNHPSTFLPKEVLMEIRTFASAAENLQQLHPRQLEFIYANKWFRMFAPKSLGGPGHTLPDVLRIEEALAWADGSTAWVVTLCSGAGWFAGFIDPTIASQLFADPGVCLAGSGAAGGKAEMHSDGYVINGEWKYASGALHATAFTANCVITQDETPVSDDDGKPLIRSFIFLRNEVQLSKSWRTMGMVATGSHGFEIKDLHVDASRMFQINNPARTLDEAIYQYPFLQLAEATLAVNYSGMAQQFMDLTKRECKLRSNPTHGNPEKVVREAISSLTECRNAFYDAVETSWSFCSEGHKIPDVVLRQVSNTSHKLYTTSLHQASALHPLTGLKGADPTTETNRIFRNIFTASQHTLFSMR